MDALHAVRALADRMREALEKGELNAFGAMLDEAWQAKKQVSSKISTSRIDQLYRVCSSCMVPWEGRLLGQVEVVFCYCIVSRNTRNRPRSAMAASAC